jgi:hypothetical protein
MFHSKMIHIQITSIKSVDGKERAGEYDIAMVQSAEQK